MNDYIAFAIGFVVGIVLPFLLLYAIIARPHDSGDEPSPYRDSRYDA